MVTEDRGPMLKIFHRAIRVFRDAARLPLAATGVDCVTLTGASGFLMARWLRIPRTTTRRPQLGGIQGAGQPEIVPRLAGRP